MFFNNSLEKIFGDKFYYGNTKRNDIYPKIQNMFMKCGILKKNIFEKGVKLYETKTFKTTHHIINFPKRYTFLWLLG